MFCRYCGTKIGDDARFCPKCGFGRMGKQATKIDVIEDNNIKFQLKPKFNITYQLLSTIGIGMVILFIFIGYPLSTFFLILQIIILTIYVIVKMIFGYMQYKNISYNFYATKVEYIDGFLTKEAKELKYEFIREVIMSQSILQRICGIGTIKIFTSASSRGYAQTNYNSMSGRNGIYIHCVDNVHEKYKIIKQIIDEGMPKEY